MASDRRPRRAGGTAVVEGRRQDLRRAEQHHDDDDHDQQDEQPATSETGSSSRSSPWPEPGPLGRRRGYPRGPRRGQRWGPLRGADPAGGSGGLRGSGRRRSGRGSGGSRGRGRSGRGRRVDHGLDLALGDDPRRLVRDDHGREVVAGAQVADRTFWPLRMIVAFRFTASLFENTDSLAALGR